MMVSHRSRVLIVEDDRSLRTGEEARNSSGTDLSPKQFDLLTFMIQNQADPLAHKPAYVCALRKKIEADPPERSIF
jgi:hypothetical protein